MENADGTSDIININNQPVAIQCIDIVPIPVQKAEELSTSVAQVRSTSHASCIRQREEEESVISVVPSLIPVVQVTNVQTMTSNIHPIIHKSAVEIYEEMREQALCTGRAVQDEIRRRQIDDAKRVALQLFNEMNMFKDLIARDCLQDFLVDPEAQSTLQRNAMDFANKTAKRYGSIGGIATQVKLSEGRRDSFKKELIVSIDHYGTKVARFTSIVTMMNNSLDVSKLYLTLFSNMHPDIMQQYAVVEHAYNLWYEESCSTAALKTIWINRKNSNANANDALVKLKEYSDADMDEEEENSDDEEEEDEDEEQEEDA